MTWQEIYNIIIAAVPSLTAIVTVLVLAIKVVSSLLTLKNSVKDGSDNVNKVVEELKQDNNALQSQVIATNNMVNELVASVETLINHTSKVQADNEATTAEVTAVKEEIAAVKEQTKKLDNEIEVIAREG